MDLKSWRDAQTPRMTQAALAAETGLSQPTIAKIESGEVWPTAETMAVIVKATGGRVTANDLLAAHKSAQPEQAA